MKNQLLSILLFAQLLYSCNSASKQLNTIKQTEQTTSLVQIIQEQREPKIYTNNLPDFVRNFVPKDVASLNSLNLIIDKVESEIYFGSSKAAHFNQSNMFFNNITSVVIRPIHNPKSQYVIIRDNKSDGKIDEIEIQTKALEYENSRIFERYYFQKITQESFFVEGPVNITHTNTQQAYGASTHTASLNKAEIKYISEKDIEMFQNAFDIITKYTTPLNEVNK